MTRMTRMIMALTMVALLGAGCPPPGAAPLDDRVLAAGWTGSWSGGGSPFSGGTITQPVKAAAGTVCSAPSYAFSSDDTTGFLDVDTTNHRLGACVNGVLAMRVDDAPDGVSTDSKGNTTLGMHAGKVLNTDTGTTGGLNNTIVGAEAGMSMTTGNQNTCFGSRSCHDMVTGVQSTALGQGALYGTTSGSSMGIGYHAGLGIADATDSIFIGGQAGESDTANHTGVSVHSVCIGFQACQAIDSLGATADVAIGHLAGTHLTHGDSNTFVGSGAGQTATATAQNVYVGTNAGNAALSNDGTMIGYAAGISVGTGASNTLVGSQAGFTGTAITTGSNNTLIGKDAQVDAAAASNRIAIGKGATNTADNSAVIGDTNITNLKLGSSTAYMQTGVGAGAPAAGDCDAASEAGRLYVETTTPPHFYYCNGSVWTSL